MTADVRFEIESEFRPWLDRLQFREEGHRGGAIFTSTESKGMKPIDASHRWAEWSDEKRVYIGKCPGLITGIHGDAPVQVYRGLGEVVQEVIDHLQQRGRKLPPPRTRPMMEVL